MRVGRLLVTEVSSPSGSSESNFMEVQVRFRLAESFARTKKSSETDGSEDFSLLFAPFSLGRRIGAMFCALASFHKNLYPHLCFLTFARLCVCQRILRYRKCLIGQLPVFVVYVQVASERGFEVDIDG